MIASAATRAHDPKPKSSFVSIWFDNLKVAARTHGATKQLMIQDGMAN